MTYAAMIARVRSRTLALKERFVGWDVDGPIFNLVNDAARQLSEQARDYRSSATLTLVAGQADYTVSTAIGTDVGEIFLIDAGDYEIRPRDLDTFATEVHDLADEEGDVANGDARYFTMLANGTTLRLSPTPAEADTATVHYSVKVSALSYTVAISALTIPLHDEYLDALLYLTIALMFESVMDFKMGQYLRETADRRFAEGRASRPDYGFGRSVEYHNPLE